MRTTALVCIGAAGAILLGSGLSAQEKKPEPKRALLSRPATSQEELKQLLKAKLSEAWVKNAAWITDYDEALAVAQEKKKRVFAYFTRSYAP